MPERRVKSAAIRVLGDILQAKRNERRMSQAGFAKEIGISFRQYKRLETGRCFPSLYTRDKLKTACPEVLSQLHKKTELADELKVLLQNRKPGDTLIDGEEG